MHSTVWYGFITLVVFITMYIIIYRIYPSSPTKDILSEVSTMNEKKNVMMPDQTQKEILGSSGSTVMAFFHLRSGDRTLRYQNAMQYVPLIQTENNWYIEIVPGPKEKTQHSARLRVNTQGNGQLNSEVIELPPIPKQKWICLTILREGRRFDVLYDNRIVASNRLKHYPVNVASALSIGHAGLDGTIAHLLVQSRRLSPSEVEVERLQRVDTNGMVLLAKPNRFFPEWKGVSISLNCPAGMPCDGVTNPPARSTYEWRSPYA